MEGAFSYAHVVDEAADFDGVFAIARVDITKVSGAAEPIVAVYAGARHTLAFGAAIVFGAGVVVVARGAGEGFRDAFAEF